MLLPMRLFMRGYLILCCVLVPQRALTLCCRGFMDSWMIQTGTEAVCSVKGSKAAPHLEDILTILEHSLLAQHLAQPLSHMCIREMLWKWQGQKTHQ